MCTTSKAFSPWRTFSRKALAGIHPLLPLLLLSFAACSGSTDDVMVKGKRVRRSLSSQFEWAVQSYEAGAYGEAIGRFEKLRKDGSEVPDFDLIAYYLGMTRYRLGEYGPAATELETFLRAQPGRQEAQDARLALLLAYEKLGRWKDSTALAAETDKLTLFQYNRALLKLLWARALRELGELQGARAVLDDSAAYLDRVGKEESRAIPFYANPDEDLWGRFHFTSVLIKTRECGLSEPKEVPRSKPVKKLYQPWLESRTDCLRAALRTATQELFVRESPWSEKAADALGQAVEAHGRKLAALLKAEAKKLEVHARLQKEAREELYRLLGPVDEDLKDFKNRGISGQPLESLRKQIDRLLVSISEPS